MNIYRQAGVVCITIYLKLLIIDRETNRQSSTGSNVGLVPWGHAEPGSDANDVPLLLPENDIVGDILCWTPYKVRLIQTF